MTTITTKHYNPATKLADDVRRVRVTMRRKHGRPAGRGRRSWKVTEAVVRGV